MASSWAKFHRAGSHLHALDAELARIGANNPQPIDTDRKVTSEEAFLYVTRVPDLRDAALLLGDAVNNLRASLDHLIWDFVKLGPRARLTSKQAMDVQFPLAQSWKSLSAQRTRRMPGIADKEFGIVRCYQPYRRDDRGRMMRLLRDLSDMDKHRYYVPAAVTHSNFRGEVRFVGCVGTDLMVCSPRRALQVGTKLLRVRIVPTVVEYDVEIQSNMTLQPSLPGGLGVMPTMRAVEAVVLEILSSFEEQI